MERESSNRYQATHRAKRRELLNAVKNAPCVDCGIQLPPACMDLDHVRGKKEFSIGNAQGWASIEKLEAEIAKCEVRCPNCHRLRHYHERLETS